MKIKNTLKLLGLVGVAVGIICYAALSQPSYVNTFTTTATIGNSATGGTNTIVNQTNILGSPVWPNLTNATSYSNFTRIDCRGAKDLYIYEFATASAANSGAFTVWFGDNQNGQVTWPNTTVNENPPANSQLPSTWALTMNGTTRVSQSTNIFVGGRPFVYITCVSNGGAGIITNWGLQYWLK